MLLDYPLGPDAEVRVISMHLTRRTEKLDHVDRERLSHCATFAGSEKRGFLYFWISITSSLPSRHEASRDSNHDVKFLCALKLILQDVAFT